MIKIVFTINRETLQFIIKDKIIYYTDRKWKNYVRCIPKDPKLIAKIIKSRNKIPLYLAKLFELSKKEQEEYDNAVTEEDLAVIIIRDGRLKGCKLVSKEVEECQD